MSKVAFDEFIEQYNNEPKIDWEARKAEWIAYLAEFYDKVETILQNKFCTPALQFAPLPVIETGTKI
jgi:hypothetical protein